MKASRPSFRLRLHDRDVWLLPGEYVLGRGSSAHILIEDPLVSRRHAVLRVEARSASIRDLGSSNGVFVDETRLGDEEAPLRSGSRVVLGKAVLQVEVGVRQVGARDAVATLTDEVLGAGERSAEAWDSLTERAVYSRPPPPSEGEAGPAPDADRRRTSEPGSPTRRMDALAMLRPFAVEALAEGRAVDAEQLLGSHLRSVLLGVKTGAPPPVGAADSAADLALQLALAGRAGWFDFVVELLDERRAPPPSDETLDRLEAALRFAPTVDVEKLRQWLRTLRARLDSLELEELRRLDRLEALLAEAVRRAGPNR